MRSAAIISIVALVLAGCSRKVVQVHVAEQDTVRSVEIQRDSVSVDRWHTVYINGDTVRETDSVIVERWHTIIDTVREVTEIKAEVPVEVPVVKEVAKPLRWWQKALMLSGALAGIATAWIVFRRLRNAF